MSYQQPYFPLSADPTPGRRAVRTMIIIGTVGIAVLALVAAVVVLRVRATATVARSAEEAVQKFLLAVADDRAEDALGLLSSPPTERSLLTEDFLRTVHSTAPMSRIRVHPSSFSAGEWSGTAISASFEVGEEYGYGTFYASETEEGWRVDNGVTPLQVADVSATIPTLTINQAKIITAQPMLFPGLYSVELDSTYLSLDEDQTTVEIGAQLSPDRPETLSYEITEEGTKWARSRVIAEADECLAKRAYVPGCGLGIAEELETGAKIDRDSISWSVTSTGRRKLEQMTFDVDPGLVSLVYSSTRVPVQVDATCADAEGEFSCGGDQSLGRPEVDLFADPATVGWRQ